MKNLRVGREGMLAGAKPHHRTYSETEVEQWHTNELAKPDPWGIRYDVSDAFLNYSSPSANSFGNYKKLKLDFLFVGGGVLSATVASVWSVW